MQGECSMGRLGVPTSVLLVSVVLCSLPAAQCSAQSEAAREKYRAGLAFKNVAKFEQAAEKFREAIAIAPDFLDAHYALAYSELSLDHLDAARNEFDFVVRRAPKSEQGQDAKRALARIAEEASQPPQPSPEAPPPRVAAPAQPPVGAPPEATPAPEATTATEAAATTPAATEEAKTAALPVKPLPSWVWIVAVVLGVIAIIIQVAALASEEVEAYVGGLGFAALVGIFFSVAAAFTMYGGHNGALLVFVLAPMIGISAVLSGILPLAGQFLYRWIAAFHLLPAFLGWFPEIQESWYTGLIYWGGMVESIAISIYVIAAVGKASSS